MTASEIAQLAATLLSTRGGDLSDLQVVAAVSSAVKIRLHSEDVLKSIESSKVPSPQKQPPAPQKPQDSGIKLGRFDQ